MKCTLYLALFLSCFHCLPSKAMWITQEDEDRAHGINLLDLSKTNKIFCRDANIPMYDFNRDNKRHGYMVINNLYNFHQPPTLDGRPIQVEFQKDNALMFTFSDEKDYVHMIAFTEKIFENPDITWDPEDRRPAHFEYLGVMIRQKPVATHSDNSFKMEYASHWDKDVKEVLCTLESDQFNEDHTAYLNRIRSKNNK